jgi:hypothetical protein
MLYVKSGSRFEHLVVSALVGFYIIFFAATASAEMTNQEMRDFAESLPCADIVYIHGLASGAQFSCGFSGYNLNLIDLASFCLRHGPIGEDLFQEILKDGMQEFFNMQNESGQLEACEQVVNDFPDILKRVGGDFRRPLVEGQ